MIGSIPDLQWRNKCISSVRLSGSTDHGFALRVFPANQKSFTICDEAYRNISLLRLSDPETKYQAMIAAVIVLSLISLLVATDSEPAANVVHPLPEPPLKPKKKIVSKEIPAADRLAA